MAKSAQTVTETVQSLPVNRLSQFVGYEMKMAYLLIQKDMARTLEPTGLRIVTFTALGIVMDNPDISQTQLSLALQIERSGVVVIVDELENADLISRNRVDGDRRSYALRATLKGQKLWARTEKLVVEHERTVFSALTDEERKTLKDLLGRIIDGNQKG